MTETETPELPDDGSPGDGSGDVPDPTETPPIETGDPEVVTIDVFPETETPDADPSAAG